MSRIATITLCAALVVGAALRVWYFGTGGPYVDEVQVLRVSSLPSVGDILDFLRYHESHPPAYYLLIRAAGAALGDAEKAATALAMLFGLALIPLAYRVAFVTLSSETSGLLVAWLVAVSPTLVRYSVMARPYAMLALLTLLAAYSMMIVARQRSRGAGLAYVAAGAAMVYSHNWSWLVLGGITIVTALRMLSERRPAAWLAWLLAANGAVALLFLPWVPALLHQTASAGYQMPLESLSPRLPPIGWILTGFTPDELLFLLAGLVVLAVLQRRMGLRLDRHRWWVICSTFGTIAAVVGLAIVLSPVTMLLIAQCFSMLTPLAVLGSVALFRTGSNAGGLSGWAFALVLALLSFYRSVDLRRFVRSNGRDIAAVLTRYTSPDDLLLFVPSYAAPEIRWHIGLIAEAHAYADGGFPALVEFNDRMARDRAPGVLEAALAKVDSAARRGAAVWLIHWRSVPPHLRSADDSIASTLRTRLGKPVLSTTGTDRPVLYNELTAWRYAPGVPVLP